MANSSLLGSKKRNDINEEIEKNDLKKKKNYENVKHNRTLQLEKCKYLFDNFNYTTENFRILFAFIVIKTKDGSENY